MTNRSAPSPAPGGQDLSALELLRQAQHALISYQGLRATDNVGAYGQAQQDGCDANGAWDSFCKTLFTLDDAQLLARIDALLDGVKP